MKKFIEKLSFKISKIFKKFMEFILNTKNYNLISRVVAMEFVILVIVIKHLKYYFKIFVFAMPGWILPMILKLGLKIKFVINYFDRVFYKDKYLIKNFTKFQESYWQFFLIFFSKYEIIVKEFFQKKYKKLIYKNIIPRSILARFKRLYLAISVDLFYRQKVAITRIFLAYFYNLFCINCKN
jgi:hypothetical protein